MWRAYGRLQTRLLTPVPGRVGLKGECQLVSAFCAFPHTDHALPLLLKKQVTIVLSDNQKKKNLRERAVEKKDSGPCIRTTRFN